MKTIRTFKTPVYPKTEEILQVMSNIKGIDMVDLEEKIMRSGAYSTLVPVVRSKVGVVMAIFDILV